jgi:hypothetical protein
MTRPAPVHAPRSFTSPPGTPLPSAVDPTRPAMTNRPTLPSLTAAMHVKRVTLTSKKNWWMGERSLILRYVRAWAAHGSLIFLQWKWTRKTIPICMRIRTLTSRATRFCKQRRSRAAHSCRIPTTHTQSTTPSKSTCSARTLIGIKTSSRTQSITTLMPNAR